MSSIKDLWQGRMKRKKHASHDLAPACMDVDGVILVEDRTPSNYTAAHIYKLLTESTRTNSVRIIESASDE